MRDTTFATPRNGKNIEFICKWSNMWSDRGIDDFSTFGRAEKVSVFKGFRLFSKILRRERWLRPETGALPTALHLESNISFIELGLNLVARYACIPVKSHSRRCACGYSACLLLALLTSLQGALPSSRIVAAAPAITRLACSLLCWLRFTKTILNRFCSLTHCATPRWCWIWDDLGALASEKRSAEGATAG